MAGLAVKNDQERIAAKLVLADIPLKQFLSEEIIISKLMQVRSPVNALVVNIGIGILALLTGKTGEIITIACFGALTLYIVSMIAMSIYNLTLMDIFWGLVGFGYVSFRWYQRKG